LASNTSPQNISAAVHCEKNRLLTILTKYLVTAPAQQTTSISFSRSGFVAERATPLSAAAGYQWLLLGCAAGLYLPLIFTGPGSDPDSLRELRSGATLLWQHRYILSRPPGYFPYEGLCGVLYALGGSVASNFATVLMSLAALDSFLHICAHFEVPHRYLLTAIMAVHPVYWASSASTIDFLWALGCFLVGFRWWLNDRYFSAAAMLGLAVGIRLSSVFLTGPLLLWALFEKPWSLRPWGAAALATAIGLALYLPEFISSGNSLSFLTYYPGAWNMQGEIGRFIYKNVYFWGLPATIFLLAIVPMTITGLIGSERKFSPIIVLSVSVVILFEALFLKLPVQRAYLLPMLPFALILLGITLSDRKPWLLAMLLMVFSYNFINLNLARPDIVDHATRAHAGIFIEPGYLLADIGARLKIPRDQILDSNPQASERTR
jgi:hypothetical protein